MMDEIGWSVPKTVDEFYAYIVALQQANSDNPDFIAFQPYNRDHLSHLDYFFFPSFGPEVDIEFGVETGSVVFSPITDQYRHYVEFMNKIYKSGAYDKNIYTEDGTAAKARILGNNTGITTYGTMYSLSNFKSGNYDVDIFAPLTSEYQSQQRYKARNVPSYAYMHMSSSCKDVETLIKWVNSLYAQRDQQIAEGVYAITGWLGVEGVNWRYVDDQLSNYEIIIPDDYKKSDTEYISEVLGYSTHMGAGIWYGLNVGNVGQLCKGMGTKNNLIPYNVDAFPEAFLSYNDEERETIVDYYTDIKDYVSSMTAKFIVGEEDIQTGWDRYVSEIKKMNIDKVIAVKQAAYDRYKALMN
jgi:putative aldouronate transport system substrate-binding protein